MTYEEALRKMLKMNLQLNPYFRTHHFETKLEKDPYFRKRLDLLCKHYHIIKGGSLDYLVFDLGNAVKRDDRGIYVLTLKEDGLGSPRGTVDDLEKLTFQEYKEIKGIINKNPASYSDILDKFHNQQFEKNIELQDFFA